MSSNQRRRILTITAGAGQMYCGSCLRDNALAAELIARGHDVILLPVYTPTRTDEPNVSRQEVLLGAISVYLEHKVPIFRHTPKLLDRLWDAPSVIRAASRRSISTDPAMLGEMTVSMLRGEHGPHRKEFEKLLDWLRNESPADITILPNALLISLAEPLARATRRPIGITLQGEDLFIEQLREPYRTQARDAIRSQAHHVDAFFAVSTFYAPFMSRYLGIEPAKMHVIPLGVNVKDFAPRTARPAGPLRVGFLARIAPEKGLHVLCAAYRRLRQRPDAPKMTLHAAGYLGREHRRYFEQIERSMRDWGLAEEFRYHGELERAEKAEFLRSLDVFSMPVTYDEPKGLSILEAMASGVPVVQPCRGAAVEIVDKTGGGLLVEPDDETDLAEGLASVLSDPRGAASLGAAGAVGVRQHYSVSRMADRALEVYDSVIEQRPAGQQS